MDEERARRFFPDWELAANNMVAILRIEAGRDPFDRGLSDLVGELSTRSDEFRTRWAATQELAEQAQAAPTAGGV